MAVFAIWLAVSFWMAWNARIGVAQRLFPDPDDAMRLVQVRDWLGGQSWFDVTQYKLNAPAGGPMHWSRLVDVPIAAVVLLARPFLGPFGAESAALIVVPLLTLGIAMLLIYRIASKLMDGPAALLAVLATPASLGAMKQMRVMRIDHHGWQIVLGLLSILALMDKRPRRAGLIAGAAMALWLNISIEGLPFAAAIGAWLALECFLDASAGERLKSYLGALAVGSVALFALTHAPSSWFYHPHDAENDAHLAGFCAAWLSCLAVVRPNIASRSSRAMLLALVGAITIGAAFLVDLHFLSGPFSSLDPVVRNYWYNGVDEGRPVWQLAPIDAAAGLAQPLVGLGGALLAVWKAPAAQRREWIIFAYLLGAMTLSGVFVIREATYASVVSLPGTAFLCEFALQRARKLSLLPVRVVATTASVFIMAPAYAAPALVIPSDPHLPKEIASADDCVRHSELQKLDSLPVTNVGAPLDITASVLANTHQRAIAGGYHRMPDAIRDVILLFMMPPEEGRQILARRHIQYLVFCPHTPESIWWSRHGPNGLAAMLNSGRTPDWLEPVDLHLRALRVWRVRQSA
ncbi:MAG: hypothetical protein HOP95_05460 [Sphingomonas sp.]|nr:hypothetical protein [Sphingomonas sp.]